MAVSIWSRARGHVSRLTYIESSSLRTSVLHSSYTLEVPSTRVLSWSLRVLLVCCSARGRARALCGDLQHDLSLSLSLSSLVAAPVNVHQHTPCLSQS